MQGPGGVGEREDVDEAEHDAFGADFAAVVVLLAVVAVLVGSCCAVCQGCCGCWRVRGGGRVRRPNWMEARVSRQVVVVFKVATKCRNRRCWKGLSFREKQGIS